jgi:hypothetical protein
VLLTGSFHHDPLPNARVGSEDDVSDGGVPERADSDGGDACAKADLCEHACEVLGGKIEVRADEVVARVLFACLLESGAAQVEHVEVAEDAPHRSVAPEDCRGRKHDGREVRGKLVAGRLDGLPYAVAL